MEKDLILSCINSVKFNSNLDLTSRGDNGEEASSSETKSSRKCALIATETEKMWDLNVFHKFKISCARTVMPHKLDIKSLNTRNLINAEFLSHLWQDTNIKVEENTSGKNKHMTTMQIELEDWWVIDAQVEMFDLSSDDVLDISAILKAPIN